MSTLIAVVLLLAIAAYAVFGGADFGAGFWDLTAGSPEQGAEPRGLIERSIGPVWEANHVWLIFIFVVTWTAFPEAYESIWLTMFVPLTIAAFGIVLRGASFAFRKSVTELRYRRIFGGGFAIASVLVPFCMGAVAGGIASGHVPSGGEAGDPVDSWLNPTSLVTGVLAIAATAYVASVYLVWDARRSDDARLVEYFRRRAVASAAVSAVLAAVGLVVMHSKAPHVFDGLTSRALPVVLVSVLSGIGALVLLLRDAARGARVLAVVAVAGTVIAWGVAQWPYLLPETLTVKEAAAPSGTLTTLVVVVVLALLIVLPGLLLLYTLAQRQLLPEEGVEDLGDGPLGNPAP
ncbi:MAG TPA: cytochrome d ubiquinol oxidase subunit II [Nocardioides sp.]|jgi:cytochrome d ubiquinol oxidase subunit II|nr:cytochrome d ubiquinol oxidase subunit II [Nocardioides sp.]